MANLGSQGKSTRKPEKTAEIGWTKLTWDDLEDWAGSRSVTRGRTYQRGGRVKDLGISDRGELLATVVGTDRYTTKVELRSHQKQMVPVSVCTCPVGASGCKHAVAVVAEYLQAVVDGRDVPLVAEDDPRWDDLENGGAKNDDEWDEAEDGSWEDDDSEAFSAGKSRFKPSVRRSASAAWDDKIKRHLRAKSQTELADLVWSLAQRYPELYREFRERIALGEGDVKQLLAEARREIRKITAEPAWRNHWSDEGHIPDYSPIRHRFERLLDLGHADEIVDLGREFLRLGLKQIGESHDEGETSMAFASCLPLVFRAVMQSSLSGPERLLYAIDAELADDTDVIDQASAIVLDAPATPEDWSAVADALTERLPTAIAEGKEEWDSFSRSYQRDRVTNLIAHALRKAGRDEEVRALYESEVRVTVSYERLVGYLVESRCFEDAERWAKEGIAATSEKYPGIADHLARSLCEIAKERKRWDVVAAHAARAFFEHPGQSTFDELVKAAGKAKVEKQVRAAALNFLETGVVSFRAVAPRTTTAPAVRSAASPKKRSARSRQPAGSSPEPKPVEPGRLAIDESWPLPVPEELIPLMTRRGHYDPGPRPHWNVLLDMAIAAEQPDEVLHWFDRMRSEPRRPGSYADADYALAYADRVAVAVSDAYPERAMEIYLAALNAQLPQAQQSAYETSAGYLKKLRPIYEALDRSDEWTALLTSIREKYRNRPRFMELLDRLDGRTIVQATRSKRKG